jgi:hypothetical protein
MLGHEALLAMRRRGLKPAQGVVLLAGLLVADTVAAATWHKQQSPAAVVWLSSACVPEGLDMRCVRALPVLLVTEAWRDKAWLRSMVARLLAFEPASLTLLRMGLDAESPATAPIVAVDAFEVQPDGQPIRCCEQTAYRRAYAA